MSSTASPVVRQTVSEDYATSSTQRKQDLHPQHGVEHFDSELEYLPSESQLVLMCLDYLRDLRRAYGTNSQDLLDVEGLHSDWLTLAVYALSRSFSIQGAARLRNVTGNNNNHGNTSTSYNHITMPVFNDAWMDSHKVLMESSLASQQEMMNPPATPDLSQLPTLEEMTKSILYLENPYPDDDDESEDDEADEEVEEGNNGRRKTKKNKNGSKTKNNAANFAESYAWYEYDDYHPSNANRFYLLNGLASSVNGRGPLLLGEIAAAGLCQLQSKSRRHAEEDLVGSPLFEQFVSAVKAKGFFQDPDHETPKDDPAEEEERLVLKKAIYDERMSKVISKFRNKLAAKVDLNAASGGADAVSSAIADFQHNRRMKRVLHSRKLKSSGIAVRVPSPSPSTLMPSLSKQMIESSSSYTSAHESPVLQRLVPGAAEAQAQEDAERLKSQGNAHMQKKEYDLASDCYTQALRISPSGPQSHVYFSNRAAALLSMKKFDQAILDSERALALKPTYSKAHARLGLAHFLLGDYRQAMEAYTVALKYEPDNKSSRCYLEKAAKKLAAAPDGGDPDTADGAIPAASSFSVVSEWDKSNNNINNNSKATNVDTITGGGRGRGHPRLPSLPPPGVAHETAEKHKNQGNSFMANREYQQALESYTSALEFSPNGPQSHVYYSNRAAALCYLERYQEAAQDSERALSLKPNYGKAHARLGLSRFFLNDYEGAVVAYTAALRYDPDNAASKSYLAKAKMKLERQQHEASINVTQEARRLMEDPDMMLMARKALSASSDLELLNDPEMKNISRRAMTDPTMKEALQHIHQVDKTGLSPTNAGGSNSFQAKSRR